MKILYTRWKDVNWVSTKSKVFEWQQAIYSASKIGDIKTVRKYQHRIMGSMDAKLLSIRRVTQDNKGKKTAGLAKVKSVPSEQRLALARSLSIPSKASPLRRVWIHKPGKTEKRLLGIPTIKDRCLQALFKLALEPEWEAKFEENSYGFRPGRNCHDAIAAIRAFVQKRPNYVLDADIAKCFDRIKHEELLNKIGMIGKYRKQLKYWLKSGVLDQDVFKTTELGPYPQGGIISPLLANIALHGMEEFCKNLIKDIPVSGSTGILVKRAQRIDMLGFVRYADDFVIMHPDLDIILLIKDKIPEFLGSIGLELSPTKTRVTHTLEIQSETKNVCSGLEGKPGFNFLGFYIRSHKTRHSTACGPSGKNLGFRTLIIPSKEKRNSHQEKLHNIVLKEGKGIAQEILIKKLNPIIRGWSNYFGKSDANTMGLLGQMDYLLYLKIRKWAKRIYKTTGKARAVFRRVGNNKWTFATNTAKLINHIDYSLPLSKYVKIKGDYSPYDSHIAYCTNRLTKNNNYNTRTKILITMQKGKCNWCKTLFTYDDIMEIDHIIPKAKGGSNDFFNLQLLHRHCHDIKTSFD
uniref:Mat4 protein n=1 Tax=Euglena myxocylindracea TaxID=38276 RepID=Q6WFV8_EUGMY|nr:maturase [Euglena myxocylindracea]